MMEAICSSETSVDFYWTTRRYIPEDSKYSSKVNICRGSVAIHNFIALSRSRRNNWQT
jgi:hypothetical protein